MTPPKEFCSACQNNSVTPTPLLLTVNIAHQTVQVLANIAEEYQNIKTLPCSTSRFGSGHGRDATTIAGAVGGAMIGDRIDSGSGTTQQQCNTVYEPGPPAGYEVTYDYKGKLLTTTTSRPPGEHLRVRNRITLE